MDASVDTATRILDSAQRLVQTRGFNGFSYADIAREVGVRTATIHYYFPSKMDLGRAVVRRYRAHHRATLERLDRDTDDPARKLERYVQVFLDTMQYQSRMCVGGMLAADQATLTDAVRAEIQGFFEDNEAWLAGVLASGRERRVFRYGGSAQEQARLLFAALEGALLIARACGDPQRLRASAQRLLAELENM